MIGFWIRLARRSFAMVVVSAICSSLAFSLTFLAPGAANAPEAVFWPVLVLSIVPCVWLGAKVGVLAWAVHTDNDEVFDCYEQTGFRELLVTVLWNIPLLYALAVSSIMSQLPQAVRVAVLIVPFLMNVLAIGAAFIAGLAVRDEEELAQEEDYWRLFPLVLAAGFGFAALVFNLDPSRLSLVLVLGSIAVAMVATLSLEKGLGARLGIALAVPLALLSLPVMVSTAMQEVADPELLGSEAVEEQSPSGVHEGVYSFVADVSENGSEETKAALADVRKVDLLTRLSEDGEWRHLASLECSGSWDGTVEFVATEKTYDVGDVMVAIWSSDEKAESVDVPPEEVAISDIRHLTRLYPDAESAADDTGWVSANCVDLNRKELFKTGAVLKGKGNYIVPEGKTGTGVVTYYLGTGCGDDDWEPAGAESSRVSLEDGSTGFDGAAVFRFLPRDVESYKFYALGETTDGEKFPVDVTDMRIV